MIPFKVTPRPPTSIASFNFFVGYLRVTRGVWSRLDCPMWAGAVTFRGVRLRAWRCRKCRHAAHTVSSYLRPDRWRNPAHGCDHGLMPAADTSGASGRPLYAEPLQAHTLIAQGAQVGTKAGANAVSSLPGTAAGSIPSSPFDAAVQTAQISLPQEDAAAVTAAAASSTTHAGGSEASVTSVTTTDTQSAGDIAKVEGQIAQSTVYTI